MDKGDGRASSDQGPPNTPTTKHRLASVSKVFTATTAMRLLNQDRFFRETLVRPARPVVNVEATQAHSTQ